MQVVHEPCKKSDPRFDISVKPGLFLVEAAYTTSSMEFFNDIGADPLKPSLFELIAQEQLKELLQPSLKYVLAVINVYNYPSTLRLTKP